MNFFAVYLRQSGQVLQVVQCPESQMLCKPDEDFIEVSEWIDPTYWYVRNNQLVKRPVLPVAINKPVLSNVPKGAQVIIEGQSYTADGTPIELEFSLPGAYPIRVVCWPYLDWEGSYEA